MSKEKLIDKLNNKHLSVRKRSLKKLVSKEETYNVNRGSLHFFSKMSYSTYYPTLCAYSGMIYDLNVVGLNDYATLSGGEEFVRACKRMNIRYSLGYHANCLPLFGEKKTFIYGYGVADTLAQKVDKELKFLREEKYETIKKVSFLVNKKLKNSKIGFSFSDVIENSMYKKGGVVTEKHLADALAKKILDSCSESNEVITFLKQLNVDLSTEDVMFLKDNDNKYYFEDLSSFIVRWIYSLEKEEKIFDSKKFIDINKEYGIVSSYKVIVNNYDEEKLETISKKLKENGFNSVTFDPREIKEEEIDKVANVFLKNGLIPIPLYEMGLPRGKKVFCENEILNKSMSAMVGNSISTMYDIGDSIFSEETINKCPEIERRLEMYSTITKTV